MNPVQADSRHRDWVRSARRQVDAADTRAGSTATGGAPRRAAVPLPPDFLPGYVLERELGRGGQGVVCLGVQKSTGQRVALKVLRDSAFSGPLERARFEQEVQILAALRHPNIVTIHDCGTVGTNPYLVMDHIEGQPLDEYVEKVEKSNPGAPGRKGEIRELLSLFATICEAVNAAHLRGVIHRDLKPSNIRSRGRAAHSGFRPGQDDRGG